MGRVHGRRRDGAAACAAVPVSQSGKRRERLASERILELNATLEQQVSERTVELAALSRRERAIFADAASAIIATDVAGVVRLFNPAAEALLGYSADEVVDHMEMIRFHDAAEVHARAEALAAQLGRRHLQVAASASSPRCSRGSSRPSPRPMSERQGAFEAGMNDFVCKPFDAERLLRTVLRGVARARGEPAAR